MVLLLMLGLNTTERDAEFVSSYVPSILQAWKTLHDLKGGRHFQKASHLENRPRTRRSSCTTTQNNTRKWISRSWSYQHGSNSSVREHELFAYQFWTYMTWPTNRWCQHWQIRSGLCFCVMQRIIASLLEVLPEKQTSSQHQLQHMS